MNDGKGRERMMDEGVRARWLCSLGGRKKEWIRGVRYAKLLGGRGCVGSRWLEIREFNRHAQPGVGYREIRAREIRGLWIR